MRTGNASFSLGTALALLQSMTTTNTDSETWAESMGRMRKASEVQAARRAEMEREVAERTPAEAAAYQRFLDRGADIG